MSVPYVTFPGVAGNYIASSKKLNLLDADTANAGQSIGYWETGPGAASVDPSTEQIKFGIGSVKALCNGTDQRIFYTDTGTGKVVLTPGVEQTCGVWLYTKRSSRVAFVSGQGYVDTTFVESYPAPTIVSLTPNTWQWIPGPSMTPAASVDNLRYQVEYRTNTATLPDNDEEVWIDAAALNMGDSAEFAPSAGIVGDLDVRTRVAATNYSSGGGSDDWQYIIGTLDSSANNGYHIILDDAQKLRAYYSDGATNRLTTGPQLALSPGTVHDFRVTFDVASGEYEFFIDDVSQGIVASTAGAGMPSGEPVRVGAYGAATSRMFTGNIYWAEIRDGIDSTIVARFDAEDIPI